jgi:hypothetical protein
MTAFRVFSLTVLRRKEKLALRDDFRGARRVETKFKDIKDSDDGLDGMDFIKVNLGTIYEQVDQVDGTRKREYFFSTALFFGG